MVHKHSQCYEDVSECRPSPPAGHEGSRWAIPCSHCRHQHQTDTSNWRGLLLADLVPRMLPSTLTSPSKFQGVVRWGSGFWPVATSERLHSFHSSLKYLYYIILLNNSVLLALLKKYWEGCEGKIQFLNTIHSQYYSLLFACAMCFHRGTYLQP